MNANFKYDTSYKHIKEQLQNISIKHYAKTRNYVNGSVTKLSAYISRGLIQPVDVFEQVISSDASFEDKDSFIRQLAWREYWQRSLIKLGSKVFTDIRKPQENIANYDIPEAVISGSTSINAIDTAIQSLYDTGYVHNHSRLYIAALVCNCAKSHWLLPAKWFYYHLFDGDIASNHLSWQWVAGTNSHRRYIANQKNINKYSFTNQTATYLDYEYDDLASQPIAESLKSTIQLCLQTQLQHTPLPRLNSKLPTLIYNSYNLDPEWNKTMDANRILLLEPSHFKKYPVSQKVIQFICDLSQNINGIQIYVGELSELIKLSSAPFFAKKHPLFDYSIIREEPPEWLFDISKDFTSFSSFWKKCTKPF